MELPDEEEQLAAERKENSGKVICAALVKAHTSVGNDWLASSQVRHQADLGR